MKKIKKSIIAIALCLSCFVSVFAINSSAAVSGRKITKNDLAELADAEFNVTVKNMSKTKFIKVGRTYTYIYYHVKNNTYDKSNAGCNTTYSNIKNSQKICTIDSEIWVIRTGDKTFTDSVLIRTVTTPEDFKRTHFFGGNVTGTAYVKNLTVYASFPSTITLSSKPLPETTKTSANYSYSSTLGNSTSSSSDGTIKANVDSSKTNTESGTVNCVMVSNKTSGRNYKVIYKYEDCVNWSEGKWAFNSFLNYASSRTEQNGVVKLSTKASTYTFNVGTDIELKGYFKGRYAPYDIGTFSTSTRSITVKF